MKRIIQIIAVWAVLPVVAGEFRTLNPIPAATALPEGAVRLHKPVPVDRGRVEAAMEQLAASWNTAELNGELSDDFYDKGRVVDAIASNVPRDARLRVLAIRGVRTLHQYGIPDPERPGHIIVVSEVGVTARAQAEFNDPDNGFQTRPGTHEYVFEVRQPLNAPPPIESANDATRTLRIFGSSTLRADTIWNFGDTLSSPNQFEHGHVYNELNLNADYQFDSYESLRLQSNFLINDSEYRDRQNGLSLERFSALYENGNAVPVRLEIGDTYADFSYRTLQRSLKGAQLEIQPFSSSNALHSLQVVSGANANDWDDFQWDDDYFSGLSYLVRTTTIGRLSLNAAHQHMQSTSTTEEKNDWVYGIAWERRMSFYAQNLTAELEANHFRGDGKDDGLFAQLSGRNTTPLTYRLRYEQYGDDFRPGGASISPARKSWETHGAWRFDNGGNLRARYQTFRDSWRSANPLDTRTTGVAYSGRVFNNVAASIDAFVQDRESADSTTDSVSNNLRVNFSKPLMSGVVGRLGSSIRDQNDQTAANVDSETLDVNFAIDRQIHVAGWRGQIAPGVRYRRIASDAPSDDWTPTIDVNFKRGAHRLDFSAQFLAQNRRATGAVDTDTYTMNAAYRYQSERYGNFGVEFESYDRDPESGERTESYKLGAFWTWNFGRTVDRPSTLFDGGIGAWSTPVAPVSQSATADGFMFRNLAPGDDVVDAQSTLRHNLGFIDQDDLIVYELVALDDIEQRQRLVIGRDGKRIAHSALIIDLDATGGPDDMLQTFNRVRRHLVSMLGRPARFFEKGDVPVDLVAAVNAGSFIRIFEWQTGAGVIRLGIPRRLDSQVRIEIRYAPSFPDEHDTLWSVERVR